MTKLRHCLVLSAAFACTAAAADTVDVIMSTTHGDIHIELYTDKAPST